MSHSGNNGSNFDPVPYSDEYNQEDMKYDNKFISTDVLPQQADRYSRESFRKYYEEKLKKENQDFLRVYNRHQELDKRVTAAEVGTAPMEDLALNRLKKESTQKRVTLPLSDAQLEAFEEQTVKA